MKMRSRSWADEVVGGARVSNAAGRPARLQTLQEVQKANRLPGAISLGLGEWLENATVRELPNGLVDRGFGSPCDSSGNR